MKKRCIHRLILYNLLLFIAIIFAISCANKENEFDNFIFKTEYSKSDAIDFNLVDCLYESNIKIIKLSSIAFNQTKDVKRLELLLKIKRDHQKIDSELKKLTENNLIILSKLAYNFNLNTDSLKGKNANFYLSNVLVNEIENQVVLFDRIGNTTQNIDFRLFAIKSKKIVQTNNEVLKKTLDLKQVKHYIIALARTIKNTANGKEII
ncbi:hypothetical protein SAMN05443549_103422 [Flavobacterium fluvii]|uniref:DUF4142 domain-containing protein n=1 Tax=Flavobacterium fluvii TaxID=468056 RepID=A0A1M5J993_9FLAO|nr:hypothetical protein [Flavobacterium fluvii]SHG37137.1 hypothetical protein SAMN05443549_103422 [Flavobacterium fluvii]